MQSRGTKSRALRRKFTSESGDDTGSEFNLSLIKKSSNSNSNRDISRSRSNSHLNNNGLMTMGMAMTPSKLKQLNKQRTKLHRSVNVQGTNSPAAFPMFRGNGHKLKVQRQIQIKLDAQNIADKIVGFCTSNGNQGRLKKEMTMKDDDLELLNELNQLKKKHASGFSEMSYQSQTQNLRASAQIPTQHFSVKSFTSISTVNSRALRRGFSHEVLDENNSLNETEITSALKGLFKCDDKFCSCFCQVLFCTAKRDYKNVRRITAEELQLYLEKIFTASDFGPVDFGFSFFSTGAKDVLSRRELASLIKCFFEHDIKNVLYSDIGRSALSVCMNNLKPSPTLKEDFLNLLFNEVDFLNIVHLLSQQSSANPVKGKNGEEPFELLHQLCEEFLKQGGKFYIPTVPIKLSGEVIIKYGNLASNKKFNKKPNQNYDTTVNISDFQPIVNLLEAHLAANLHERFLQSLNSAKYDILVEMLFGKLKVEDVRIDFARFYFLFGQNRFVLALFKDVLYNAKLLQSLETKQL